MEETSKRNEMITSSIHHFDTSGMNNEESAYLEIERCSDPGSATNSSWYLGHSFSLKYLRYTY